VIHEISGLGKSTEFGPRQVGWPVSAGFFIVFNVSQRVVLARLLG